MEENVTEEQREGCHRGDHEQTLKGQGQPPAPPALPAAQASSPRGGQRRAEEPAGPRRGLPTSRHRVGSPASAGWPGRCLARDPQNPFSFSCCPVPGPTSARVLRKQDSCNPVVPCPFRRLASLMVMARLCTHTPASCADGKSSQPSPNLPFIQHSQNQRLHHK